MKGPGRDWKIEIPLPPDCRLPRLFGVWMPVSEIARARPGSLGDGEVVPVYWTRTHGEPWPVFARIHRADPLVHSDGRQGAVFYLERLREKRC